MPTPRLVLAVWIAVFPAALLSTAAFAQTDISIDINAYDAAPVSMEPPPLPVYDIPPPPMEEAIWIPGHWRWNGRDYYWVPGTWVIAPEPGLYWTPGYWAYRQNAFYWNEGYWGPRVGFYGGINYGGGYYGHGFNGGYWRHGHYTHVTNITNVTNVTNITNIRNVSYHGGPHGVRASETNEERQAEREKHLPPTREQIAHAREAAERPEFDARKNGGKPPIAATERPNDFKPAPPAPKPADTPRDEKHPAPHRPEPNRPMVEPKDATPPAEAPKDVSPTPPAELPKPAPKPQEPQTRHESPRVVQPSSFAPQKQPRLKTEPSTTPQQGPRVVGGARTIERPQTAPMAHPAPAPRPTNAPKAPEHGPADAGPAGHPPMEHGNPGDQGRNDR